MSRRWIRLDVEWEESAWLDGLPGQSAGCWPRLLCWVKLRGKKGRCKAPDLVVDKDLTYREAAEEMGIAERTVRNYASEIGKRLGRSPQLAMAWYFYNKLTGPL